MDLFGFFLFVISCSGVWFKRGSCLGLHDLNEKLENWVCVMNIFMMFIIFLEPHHVNLSLANFGLGLFCLTFKRVSRDSLVLKVIGLTPYFIYGV